MKTNDFFYLPRYEKINHIDNFLNEKKYCSKDNLHTCLGAIARYLRHVESFPCFSLADITLVIFCFSSYEYMDIFKELNVFIENL